MSDLIQIRRDTLANWESNNPVLAAGEFGLATDTLDMRVGDGSNGWKSLPGVLDRPFRDESSTSYTLVIGDASKVIRFTGASPAVTIPQEASVNFPVGTVIEMRQAGTGTLALTTTGLTLNGSFPTWSQHVQTTIRKVASDTWDVV